MCLHSSFSFAKDVLEQVIHSKFDSNSDRGMERSIVKAAPPMKPSQVFFGDNLINGVRPNIFPAK